MALELTLQQLLDGVPIASNKCVRLKGLAELPPSAVCSFEER